MKRKFTRTVSLCVTPKEFGEIEHYVRLEDGRTSAVLRALLMPLIRARLTVGKRTDDGTVAR